ncbi:hypothetical protein BO70DRAFT_359703 [Aspergillus heteromorphus CBS 117.55]|uniref:Uncharacterized protein n=1 Tax=Aspergillus heteromorphus CBS 117.55 TaxID=1448321 RepID=A0A317WVD9_9EURO|nr:uncharacterized protein BO70DRAFT_359703 [Aspergillus heteromorphus CBS 117.55]PWY88240.1 hypothetical protein BO70DRAFT_359703 [Aspergillus heteromorphus CBS 117.55]
MSDRRSDSSYEATVQEATVGIKGDPETLNQLSSSGRSAQQRRIKTALASLDDAARDLEARERGHGQSGGGTATIGVGQEEKGAEGKRET